MSDYILYTSVFDNFSFRYQPPISLSSYILPTHEFDSKYSRITDSNLYWTLEGNILCHYLEPLRMFVQIHGKL